MFQKRFSALIITVLLVGCFVGQGLASETTADPDFDPLGIAVLVANGTLLSEEEMNDITGEHIGTVIGGAIAGYGVTKVLDYYGVGDWLQETAIPAVESAVVSAYETAKEVLSNSLEMIGEAIMEDPYLWMW